MITATILVMITVPISAGPPAPIGEKPSPEPPPPTSRRFVPGEILVKFKPGVGSLSAQNALQAEGLRTLEVSQYEGVMRVQVPPGHEADAIAALLDRGDVAIASYNHIFQASIEPDDSYYAIQWALPKIGAPSAWDVTTGSSNVTVALIDSGLDMSHSEFSGRIVYPRDEIEEDGTPQDTCDHGTHVTGILAAQGNNGSGIAGVAWDVKILPVRVLTGNSSGCTGSEFDIRDGIYWAVNHGARVINLSLGALPDFGQTCEQTYKFMSTAIEDAYNAGVLVVAAAGNYGASGLTCPALQPETMSVGATTSTDQRAWYSNYGTGLSVVAPGDDIFSTIPGGYGYISGTSMATPHVAGLAALVWSLDPSLTNDQVRDRIQDSADDLGVAGWDQYFGYGRINAWHTLESLVSLQTSPDQAGFLVDDDSGPVPPSKSIQVTTTSPNVINWVASISPSVSWLSVVPPASGTVSAASAASFTLVASRPPAYGTYSATVIVTGITSSGGTIGPVTTEVRISYVPDLYEYRFPLIFKNQTP